MSRKRKRSSVPSKQPFKLGQTPNVILQRLLVGRLGLKVVMLAGQARLVVQRHGASQGTHVLREDIDDLIDALRLAPAALREWQRKLDRGELPVQPAPEPSKRTLLTIDTSLPSAKLRLQKEAQRMHEASRLAEVYSSMQPVQQRPDPDAPPVVGDEDCDSPHG